MSNEPVNSNRVANKEQSDLHVATLDDKDTCQCLTTLREVFRTCYGPHGKIHMLHNNVGGHVTLTGCSGRILQALSVNNALARVVTTSAESHLSRFPDGGLFTGLLCLLLVENSLKLENDNYIHRYLLTDINEVLLSECLHCLNSPDFEASAQLNFSNIDMALNYIKTTIQSKLISCGLRPRDLDHFAPLILKTFMEVYLPSNHLGTVHYLTIEGLMTTESKVLNGVLFQMPTIPVYKKDPLKLKRKAEGPLKGLISIALVRTSMSGDTEELPEATYELSHMQDITDVVLQELTQYVSKLIGLQIGMLACQKVVHPRLKKMLREAGVYVIDRLGAKYTEALRELSGAQLIGSFTTDPDASTFGTLDDVEHVVIQDTSYIHMKRTSSSVVTLLLCGHLEQTTQELKYVVKSCIESLAVVMGDSRILCGGGCWMTMLAHKVKHQIEQKIETLCSKLSCTKHQLLTGLGVFVRSLEQVTIHLGHPAGDHLTDTAHNHYWSVPSGCISAADWSFMTEKSCLCGAVTDNDGKLQYTFIGESKASGSVFNRCSKDTLEALVDMNAVKIWDSLVIYTGALQNAVLTANMILGVHSYIQNTN